MENVTLVTLDLSLMKKYISRLFNPKVAFLIIACCWGEVNYAQEGSSKPYSTQLIMVENHLRVGKYGDALMEMDRITDAYPSAAEVFYGKALVLAQIGNLDGALENAIIAFDKEPSLLHGNYLVDLNRAKQNNTEVLRLLTELRARYPNQTAISRDLINTLTASKKLSEAQQIFEEERSKGFTSDTLDIVMADAYIQSNKITEAKKLLIPLRGQSKLRHVYGSLAYVYGQEKKSKEAIKVLEEGLQLTNDPFLHLDLADIYKSTNKPTLTYLSLKKAFEANSVEFGDKHRIMYSLMNTNNSFLTLDQLQDLANVLVLQYPRIAESHIIKGEIVWRKGNVEEARSLFLTAVGIHPKHVDAWRMLINTDLALNKVDDAIAHGREALNINSGNPMLMYFTGLAFMVKDDLDSSRKLLEMALDHSERENDFLKSNIYSSLGDLYHKLDMESASDVAYIEAITLDSTNVSAMNNLAYYLSVRGKDLDKAAEYAKNANILEPNNPTFQDTYAWVLFRQGNYKDALLWMEKAIKGSNTPSAVLLEHYGDALAMNGNVKEAVKQWEKSLLIADEEVKVEKIKQKIKERKYVD